MAGRLLILIVALAFAVPARAVEYQDVKYAVGGRTMHAVIVGSPALPPVLLIHGTNSSWKTWKRVLKIDQLTSRFQLIAVDRPGYGGSGLGRAETSLGRQAMDAAAVLGFNRSGKKPIVVGFSYGGGVAARIAMDHPGGLEGLVLVAPTLSPELERPRWYEVAAHWNWTRWFLLPSWVVAGDESVPLPVELERQVGRYSTIQGPIIYLQGDRDNVVSIKTAAYAAHMLNHAQLRVWWAPGIDHMVPIRRPDLIEKAIDEVAPHS